MKKQTGYTVSPFGRHVTEHWKALWGSGAKSVVDFGGSLDATGTRCQQTVRWRLSEDDRPLENNNKNEDVEQKKIQKKK